MYENESLQKKYFDYETTWEIEGKKLFMEIKKINYIIDGFENLRVDKNYMTIIELSEKNLILEDDKGVITKMIKFKQKWVEPRSGAGP